MAYGNYIKRKARQAVRKVGQAVKKRYTNKRGGTRMGRVVKDVAYLKSVLNPEKKRYDDRQPDPPDGFTALCVGQTNGNNDGGYYEDVTPLPSQGVTFNTRNGASIKLHSSIWNFQFKQQVGVVADIKVIIEIFAIDKEPYTGFTFRNERFEPNYFITGGFIYDYNTQLNPDNFMKGRCIARRKLTIKGDSVGSQSNLTHVKIPVLYNKGQGRHIRFNRDTQTVESGQLVLIIRTDRGNISSTPSTLLVGVPDINANTGLEMRYNRIDYFYDN